ncbi:hypothetical protein KDN34_07845 [Shewanella yunxiaonensis]|uniref:Uncharacterized protein n=1 Tax=Shewanella yunxiaonensis TaxID=2829809 RepID=A0ABX7YXX0_9GAMM|nr:MULTISPECIES: hypothetical protein [Shewanella]MDF0535480.1 hypothetical protein [Shewanella sp. A32]QUN07313.1 hypothetical protein KDN34_07845 [Shewanella yunxiaonensis]
MKRNIKYGLMAKGCKVPLGYFLNGLFYERAANHGTAQGFVDEKGYFYAATNGLLAKHTRPTAKIEGLTYIRLADIAEFELVMFDA